MFCLSDSGSGGLCPPSSGGFEPGPKQTQADGGGDENGDAQYEGTDAAFEDCSAGEDKAGDEEAVDGDGNEQVGCEGNGE